MPRGLNLYVCGSYGGAPVADAEIRLVSGGGYVEIDQPVTGRTSSGGYLLLDPEEGLISLLVTAPGRAASLLQDYSFTGGRESIELVLPVLGIESAQAQAPRFDQILYAPAGGTESNLLPGTPLPGEGEILVDVSGVQPVVQTQDSGFGIAMMVDTAPSGFGLIIPDHPDGYLTEGLAVQGRYHSSAKFLIDEKIKMAGDHYLAFVAYDVANNRVEKRIPVTSAGSSEVILALDKMEPEITLFEMKSFGVDRGLYSLSARPEVYRQGTGYMVFTVRGINESNAYIPYEGFEIWRTESGKLPYQKVKTVNLSSLSIEYEMVDVSAQIQPGKRYDYKVRAFNSGGFSGYSRVKNVIMLPEHHLVYEGPADGSAINPSTTALQFRINSLADLRAGGIEYYFFSLRMESVDGSRSLVLVPGKGYIPTFGYSFEDGVFLLAVSSQSYLMDDSVSLDLSSGVVSIQPDSLLSFFASSGLQTGATVGEPFTLDDGVSYTWYLDYSLHGPSGVLQYVTREDGQDELKGISTSIASSVEYEGAAAGSSMLFTVERSAR